MTYLSSYEIDPCLLIYHHSYGLEQRFYFAHDFVGQEFRKDLSGCLGSDAPGVIQGCWGYRMHFQDWVFICMWGALVLLISSLSPHGFHPPKCLHELQLLLQGDLRGAELLAGFLGHVFQEIKSGRCYLPELAQCHFCCILLVKVLHNLSRVERRGHRLYLLMKRY